MAEFLNEARVERPHSAGNSLARPMAISPAEAGANVRAWARAPWYDATLPTVGPMQLHGGETITVPVTVASGEKDRVLPPRPAIRAARVIPRARIIKLTGCGHIPTYDDPAQVARVLLKGARD